MIHEIRTLSFEGSGRVPNRVFQWDILLRQEISSYRGRPVYITTSIYNVFGNFQEFSLYIPVYITFLIEFSNRCKLKPVYITFQWGGCHIRPLRQRRSPGVWHRCDSIVAWNLAIKRSCVGWREVLEENWLSVVIYILHVHVDIFCWGSIQTHHDEIFTGVLSTNSWAVGSLSAAAESYGREFISGLSFAVTSCPLDHVRSIEIRSPDYAFMRVCNDLFRSVTRMLWLLREALFPSGSDEKLLSVRHARQGGGSSSRWKFVTNFVIIELRYQKR